MASCRPGLGSYLKLKVLKIFIVRTDHFQVPFLPRIPRRMLFHFGLGVLLAPFPMQGRPSPDYCFDLICRPIRLLLKHVIGLSWPEAGADDELHQNIGKIPVNVFIRKVEVE